MAQSLSAEEVHRKHLAVLGPRLGPLYHRLWNECSWVHVRWHQFEELFGMGPGRVDILNAAGASFFGIVQDVLWEAVLLHLTALTDPPQSAGKDNLTVRAIPPLLPDQSHRREIDELVSEATRSTEFARDWRNRRIAHRDLDLALDIATKPLASASRNQVIEALKAVSDVLRRLSLLYLKEDVVFGLVPPLRGAEDVLYCLRDGLEVERRRRGGWDDWGELPPI